MGVSASRGQSNGRLHEVRERRQLDVGERQVCARMERLPLGAAGHLDPAARRQGRRHRERHRGCRIAQRADRPVLDVEVERPLPLLPPRVEVVDGAALEVGTRRGDPPDRRRALVALGGRLTPGEARNHDPVVVADEPRLGIADRDLPERGDRGIEVHVETLDDGRARADPRSAGLPEREVVAADVAAEPALPVPGAPHLAVRGLHVDPPRGAIRRRADRHQAQGSAEVDARGVDRCPHPLRRMGTPEAGAEDHRRAVEPAAEPETAARASGGGKRPGQLETPQAEQ